MKQKLSKLVLALLFGWWSVLVFWVVNADGLDNQYEPDVDVRDWDDWLQEEWIIDWIQTVVNWVLWLIWLVALIMLLWWGFLMVTAAGEDDRYQKWFKILKQVWIWLIILGVSWLIISLIFRIIGL